jgi:hypothetical protein
MSGTAWREYERDVAATFAEAGLHAEVDAALAGARATHRIDVVVAPAPREAASGRVWLAECKRQQRRVTKAAVLAFLSVLQDVGGERGFLVSETPFQPAAVMAARKTAITLCTLASLRDELQLLREPHQLGILDARASQLEVRLFQMHSAATPWGIDDYSDLVIRAVNWNQYAYWRDCTHAVIAAVRSARRNEWPTVAGFAEPHSNLWNPASLSAENVDALVEIATTQLGLAEDWADAAERWVALPETATRSEYQALATRLRCRFLQASWQPKRPAGKTNREDKATARLWSARGVSLGYHAKFTKDGIGWIADDALYFILDGQTTVCLASERWTKHDEGAVPRLILESTDGPISAIDVHRTDLGKVRRIRLLSTEEGAEAGAIIDLDSGSVISAWTVEEGNVEYSLDGFPRSTRWSTTREVTREHAT